MAQKDYYNILGVKKNASTEEIRKAYTEKARSLHPDVSKDPNATAKFQEVNEAYSILKDTQKKRNYDTYGNADGPGQGFDAYGFNEGAGFSQQRGGADIFEEFEDMMSFFSGQGRKKTAKGPEAGADITTSIGISLEDSFFGKQLELSYERLEKCDSCDGQGYKGANSSCTHCNGRGSFFSSASNFFSFQQTCSYCDGTGIDRKCLCKTCKGSGGVHRKTSLKTEIPRGVEEGQKIVMSKGGNIGKKSGPYGNLIININIQKHSIFVRERANLHMNYNIPVDIAILGGVINITTIDQKQTAVKVPSGIQNNTVLTILEGGMPILNSNRRGNLLINIKVIVPVNLTPQQQELIKSLNLKEHK